MNYTVPRLVPRQWRFNEHYVLWYKNVAGFLVTGTQKWPWPYELEAREFHFSQA